MIDNARTGAYIAFLRQKAGMTQQQLADMMNVTHQAVSKWENGTALPDAQTLLNLSALFNVSMEQMLTVPDEVLKADDTAAPADTDEQAATEENTSETAGTKPMNWKHIVRLAPFLSKDALGTLVTNAYGEIGVQDLLQLAPFLHKTVVNEYCMQLVENDAVFEPRMLVALAPFVSADVLSRIVDNLGDALADDELASLAPFLTKEYTDNLAAKIYASGNMERLSVIAPFVSRGALEWMVTGKKPETFGDTMNNFANTVRNGLNDAMNTMQHVFSGVQKAFANAVNAQPEKEEAQEAAVETDTDKDFLAEGLELIARKAIENDDWARLEKLFNRVSEQMQAEILTAEMDNDQWQLVLGQYPMLGQEKRVEILNRLMDEEMWDMVVANASMEDEETRFSCAMRAIEEDKAAAVRQLAEQGMSDEHRAAMIKAVLENDDMETAEKLAQN